MIHPPILNLHLSCYPSIRWAFDYLISRTGACIHSGFWRLIPSPRNLTHTHPLHLSGSVSAHLHVTTCIEFFLSWPGFAGCLITTIPLLATYINIYLILLVVLRVRAVFSYCCHGLVLWWRFLASRVCYRLNFRLSGSLEYSSNMLCFHSLHSFLSDVAVVPYVNPRHSSLESWRGPSANNIDIDKNIRFHPGNSKKLTYKSACRLMSPAKDKRNMTWQISGLGIGFVTISPKW